MKYEARHELRASEQEMPQRPQWPVRQNKKERRKSSKQDFYGVEIHVQPFIVRGPGALLKRAEHVLCKVLYALRSRLSTVGH